MRQLLLLVVTFTSALAFAEVAKPKNTIEVAHGEAQVAGVHFEYQVRDRGWTTHAKFENGKASYAGQKSFLVHYGSEKKSDLPDTLAVAMFNDAKAKCQELGDIEFKEQTKGFSEQMTKKLTAEIINHRTERIKETSTAWGVFNCLITINVDG